MQFSTVEINIRNTIDYAFSKVITGDWKFRTLFLLLQIGYGRTDAASTSFEKLLGLSIPLDLYIHFKSSLFN